MKRPTPHHHDSTTRSRDGSSAGRPGFPELSRRRLLAGLGATGASLLAGCVGGDSGGDPTPGFGDGTGDGAGDGGGRPGSDGDGTTDGDGDAGPTDGAVGEVLSGALVSFAVEYVRPVEEVLEFQRFSRTTDEEGYGIPRTVDHYVDMGLAEEGSSFYGVGVAVANTHDAVVDAATVLLRGDDTAAFGVFPARSQRLTFRSSARGGGRPLVPGELQRGELVFALPRPPADYTLEFQPSEVGRGVTDRLTVDLGRGAEATAPFVQDPAVVPTEEPVGVGDFDVTLHAVERVASVADSPHQELFGARDGYDYLRVELSATRTGDAMIGQDWSLGMADVEGYGYAWNGIYQDVFDLNGTRLEQLSVGESIEHTVFAFLVAADLEPAYLTMTAPGPLESSGTATRQGIHRIVWALA